MRTRSHQGGPWAATRGQEELEEPEVARRSHEEPSGVRKRQGELKPGSASLGPPDPSSWLRLNLAPLTHPGPACMHLASSGSPWFLLTPSCSRHLAPLDLSSPLALAGLPWLILAPVPPGSFWRPVSSGPPWFPLAVSVSAPSWHLRGPACVWPPLAARVPWLPLAPPGPPQRIMLSFDRSKPFLTSSVQPIQTEASIFKSS